MAVESTFHKTHCGKPFNKAFCAQQAIQLHRVPNTRGGIEIPLSTGGFRESPPSFFLILGASMCVFNGVLCIWDQISVLLVTIFCWKRYFLSRERVPGCVAQSVTCLATDACLTAIPGVASSIPASSHTFVEIDHEIISTVILLPSAASFKKGCCQLQAKVCARITGYPLVQACPGKKCG